MLLSRIIKSGSFGSSDNKTIAIPFQTFAALEPAIDLVRKAEGNLDAGFIENAQKKASSILEQAEMKKLKVIKELEDQKSEWENEKKDIQKAAYEKAFAAGYEEGRKKGYSDTYLLIEEARQIVSSTKLTLEHHLARNEEVILELSIKAAEKIMNQTLKGNPENFLPIIKKGLKEASEMKEISIHIAPSQYSFVKEKEEELYPVYASAVRIYLYPDEKLEPFQCFIESDQGRIDISVDSQLQEMKQQLVNIMGDSA